MRVLFVDDDQKLLRGMRRILLSKGCGWQTGFASGGREALDMLGAEAFDVIIADMRMPGMDGAELLGAVQRDYPGIVRIVLSGHSDHDFIMKAVRPAHQFLSKPCPEDELIEVVDRVLGLRSIFADTAIRDAVTKLDTLPIRPQAYDQLQAELDKKDCSLARIGTIVSSDVGLSANILKLVNSSFFGLRHEGRTPAQAATYLGVDVLRTVVLSDGLFTPTAKAGPARMSFGRLWAHSQTTAHFATAIAKIEGNERSVCDLCFVSALLHDVGKLVLAHGLGKEYEAVLASARDGHMPIHEAEADVLGVSHAQAGGYLLGLWGFCPDVVLSIVNHNTPPQADGDTAILPYLHAANALEHELVRINDDYAPHPVDADYLASRGLAGRTAAWRQTCEDILHNGGEV